MKYSYQIALSFAMEDQEIAEKVYYYLKAEGISVFYAPAPECQIYLSGKNQREVFYEVFGLKAEYVALLVSASYIVKKVPMEEAGIAIAKHSENGSVIPVYLDGSPLPADLFSPDNTNYFKSNAPAKIADHLSKKIKVSIKSSADGISSGIVSDSRNIMNINNNKAEKQIFIQTMKGSIEL